PAAPRAAAVPGRRPLTVVARRDGEIPRSRPFALGRRLGALRGPDGRRHAVRLASGGPRLLAHRQAGLAAPALAVPGARDARLLGWAALPAARRGVVDHVPRPDLRRVALVAAASRARAARTANRVDGRLHRHPDPAAPGVGRHASRRRSAPRGGTRQRPLPVADATAARRKAAHDALL